MECSLMRLAPFHLAFPVTDLNQARTFFIIEPQVRFSGEIGEQSSMFFLDPSGNAIEFKAFKDPSKLFAKA
jgi:extradiol dioxygenase family protein